MLQAERRRVRALVRKMRNLACTGTAYRQACDDILAKLKGKP